MDTPKKFYLVVVPYYWGKAKTIKGAWKEIENISNKDKKEFDNYSIFETDDPKICVDNMGRIIRDGGTYSKKIESK